MESPHIPSSWCSGLVANYLKALESCLLSADMGVLLLDAEGTHPTYLPRRDRNLGHVGINFEWAVSGDSTCLSPPMWVQPPSHSRIWVSTSPVVNPPFDVLVIYVRQGSFDFPLGQLSVCVGGYRSVGMADLSCHLWPTLKPLCSHCRVSAFYPLGSLDPYSSPHSLHTVSHCNH